MQIGSIILVEYILLLLTGLLVWNCLIRSISMVLLGLILLVLCGPGSSVGIATAYGLDGPGSNPSGDEIFRPSRLALGPTPASCKMGTMSFPEVKCGRGVLLTTHPLLVPRSWKRRAKPVPTLWAIPGLQRDHFTFTFPVSIIIVIANPKMSGTVRVADMCFTTIYGKIRVA